MDLGLVAIGDVHGCFLSLKALLEQLSVYKERTFVFLGDYIDRGPQPKEVIDLLISFDISHRCIFLRGNHEQMLLDYVEDQSKMNWLMNGGKQTKLSYVQSGSRFELPYQHYHFFQNTRLYYETPSYVFAHGGLDPEFTVAANLEDESMHSYFLWERSHLKIPNKWEKTVVFGHTPAAEPILKNKMIGIDTGCVYKNLPGLGKLTAVLLPELTFIQQNCIDKPEPY